MIDIVIFSWVFAFVIIAYIYYKKLNQNKEDE